MDFHLRIKDWKWLSKSQFFFSKKQIENSGFVKTCDENLHKMSGRLSFLFIASTVLPITLEKNHHHFVTYLKNKQTLDFIYLQYLTRVFSIDFISESGVILSRSSKGLGLSRYCSNSSKGILVLIVLLMSLLNREFLLHSLVLMVLLFWVVWEETALKLSTWEAE